MRRSPVDRFRSFFLTALVAMSAVAYSPTPAAAAAPTYTFNGGGWGHGVGLSQYGAQGYAKQGWTYDRILAHYYQGTKLVTKPTAKVRVNLDDGASSRSQWKIKAGSTTPLAIVQESDTAIRKDLNATSSYWITTSGSNTRVCADASGKPGTVLKTFSGACFASAGGLVEMSSKSGPFNYAGIRWRGTIHFKPATATTSKAVNYVDLEEYLYGVVPRESPSSWNAEALKAQAVAARSYAYQDAVDKRTLYCTTKSQVYNGKSRPNNNHEADSTNAAVNATKGQLVWYGSETKPVKTYFSSCSGGHTANIETVWGSAAKPYYEGVEDADQASPYYRWSAGAYSAAFVADKVRALDIARGGGLDYSASSPAIVTNISTERAGSGWTHHVTLTWSNGAKYRITGATLQSALGLRSAKYGVARTYPVVKKTRVQERDTRLAWSGLWKRLTSTSVSNGTMFYSATANSSLVAEFSGNGIVWIAKKGPTYGRAAVYVDGKLVKTVDLYSSKSKYRQTVFSTTSLGSGKHKLAIKVLRTKRSASRGYTVSVDALDVVNGTLSQAAIPITRYQQDHMRIARIGAWSTVTASVYSGGTVLRTDATDARLYATFYGTYVRWIGTAATTYGRALVSIDGGAPEDVVMTADATTYQKVLYTKTGLSKDRAHTIMIQPLGTGGTHGLAAVDAIEVGGGWLLPAWLPARQVDQTDARIGWSGTWGTTTSTKLVGGSHRWSNSSASSAVVKFDGTGIVWIGKKAKSYGKSRVYVDGVYKATIDQYQGTTAYRQTIWSSGWLPSGTHTLELRPAGAHSGKSSGNTVSVDAFRVYGQVLDR